MDGHSLYWYCFYSQNSTSPQDTPTNTSTSRVVMPAFGLRDLGYLGVARIGIHIVMLEGRLGMCRSLSPQELQKSLGWWNQCIGDDKGNDETNGSRDG